ncbi:hypothetical protein Pflav_007680 [Phytohabitans flavus]|uniref:Aminotransferase class I/classII domain-containing protein n=1 Tax=Phytohabitans flavus TaxID=1076124 RepID=A0A6F8XKN7_9ACTN|nr:hypothetical protein Pflav_007680 [Phytohabitans flavus]
MQLTDLHGSLSDPLLDTMNFLNEVTARFPDAVSFAPGRPYDEAFEPSVVAGYLDAYAKYLERDRGLSQRQVGGLLFQYGRTKGQIHDLVAATIANDEGIEVPPESIVVTVGAQEGMLLALRVLFRDFADVLLVASPATSASPVPRGCSTSRSSRYRRVRPVWTPERYARRRTGCGRAGGAPARCTWCPTSPTRRARACR